MKFILHELKLWFQDENAEPKSYDFLPDKVNVITGDSSTGKTSFWNIIDYCLLSGKVTIPTEIINKVLWFGIRFTINDKEISIVRRTPSNGSVSSDVSFNLGIFPDNPEGNSEVAEIRAILDEEFGISDALRFPYGKGLGRTTFNISYRHFLLFNSLTQTIIDAPETYFDTTFYGKDEYDKALGHIFDLVIGVNDMENIKAIERLQEIEAGLKAIQNQEKGNQNKIKNFETEIFKLVEKCRIYKFIEYSEPIESVDEALIAIKETIANTKKAAENSRLFSELDGLHKSRNALQAQINAIGQYQKEYITYKKNLNKSADSLQPIEYLSQQLSDQLVDSYETKLFVESLEASLKSIKTSLSKKVTEPLKITGDVKELRAQIHKIEKQVAKLIEIKKNYQSEGEKFIVLGEIKYAYEQILKKEAGKPIDKVKLNSLNEEKERLSKVPQETSQIKFLMKTELNQSIQRNFNLLNSLPTYKGSRVEFNSDKMILQLIPDGQMFPLDNVGSASNYMFMHLCVYLGLHEHVLNIEQDHVPEFLFIDQPSTPYYEGKNDDKAKLIDAFTLLNSFIHFIRSKKNKHFQIIMVEHASKEYWIDNKLAYFHTVDEFLEGKGLVPNDIYKS